VAVKKGETAGNRQESVAQEAPSGGGEEKVLVGGNHVVWQRRQVRIREVYGSADASKRAGIKAGRWRVTCRSEYATAFRTLPVMLLQSSSRAVV